MIQTEVVEVQVSIVPLKLGQFATVFLHADWFSFGFNFIQGVKFKTNLKRC